MKILKLANNIIMHVPVLEIEGYQCLLGIEFDNCSKCIYNCNKDIIYYTQFMKIKRKFIL